MKLKILNNQSTFKLWEGRSPYDNSAIVAVITNLRRPSKNPKTGPMSQLWVLPQNEEPWKAIKNGKDSGICGDCIYAPERAWRTRDNGYDIPVCYVGRRAFQAPSNVWKASIHLPTELENGIAAIERSGLPVRYGAYGDIGMLPEWLVCMIYDATNRGTKGNRTHTAYTHQYNRKWAAWTKKFAMASVNNETDGILFRSLNWRTFRITPKSEAGLGEIICPNYTHGTTCIKCQLCNGSSGPNDNRKSITIPAH